ncbi:MAG TPA: GNAT family N-acetyltransferase [Candidatus Limnocylindrales bacterium]|nr:GNAT family N-acetyltransferase [Candidatus Limnocylindrales bacterium]
MSQAPPDPVPGISWRPLGRDDAERILELANASFRGDSQPYVMTLAEVQHTLADERIDLARDTIGGFTDDGALACFGAARPRAVAVRRRIIYQDGEVHPSFRRRGLGSAVLSYTEARSAEILAQHRQEQPDDGVPAYLEAYCDERLADRIALFERRGYQPIRWYTDMRRDLADPLPDPAPLPAGLELVGWTPELDEAYRVAHVTAFDDHWGSEPLTSAEWHTRFTGSPMFRPDLTVAAADEVGRLVAYVIGYHAADDTAVTGRVEGWLGQVGTLREWRGRGLATALMVRVMRLMRDAGMQDAKLDVDTENQTGAMGLYERLGFRPEHRSIRWARQA